eukprot:SM000036S13355  [mRNA]  locus=s36:734204:736782:- [translate_table: standard]
MAAAAMRPAPCQDPTGTAAAQEAGAQRAADGQDAWARTGMASSARALFPAAAASMTEAVAAPLPATTGHASSSTTVLSTTTVETVAAAALAAAVALPAAVREVQGRGPLKASLTTPKAVAAAMAGEGAEGELAKEGMAAAACCPATSSSGALSGITAKTSESPPWPPATETTLENREAEAKRVAGAGGVELLDGVVWSPQRLSASRGIVTRGSERKLREGRSDCGADGAKRLRRCARDEHAHLLPTTSPVHPGGGAFCGPSRHGSQPWRSDAFRHRQQLRPRSSLPGWALGIRGGSRVRQPPPRPPSSGALLGEPCANAEAWGARRCHTDILQSGDSSVRSLSKIGSAACAATIGIAASSRAPARASPSSAEAAAPWPLSAAGARPSEQALLRTCGTGVVKQSLQLPRPLLQRDKPVTFVSIPRVLHPEQGPGLWGTGIAVAALVVEVAFPILKKARLQKALQASLRCHLMTPAALAEGLGQTIGESLAS